MSVRLLFFSMLQDIVGSENLDFPLPSDSLTVNELLRILFNQFPGLQKWDDHLLVAVNGAYARRDDLIHPGDEIAIMPPVQGG